MSVVRIYTCVLRQVPRAIAGHPDRFQVVQESLQGGDNILHEGSFYDCRSFMERHYLGLIRNSEHFTVYWRDEFSLLVYNHGMAAVPEPDVAVLGGEK